MTLTLTRTHFTAAFLIGALVVAGWRASTTGLVTATPTSAVAPTTQLTPEPTPPEPVPFPPSPTPVKPTNPSRVERLEGGVVVHIGGGK